MNTLDTNTPADREARLIRAEKRVFNRGNGYDRHRTERRRAIRLAIERERRHPISGCLVRQTIH